MSNARMTKQGRLESLRRNENAARTVGEFQELTRMYDDLDALRERRERRHEIGKSEYKLLNTEIGKVNRDIAPEQREAERKNGYSDGAVVPPPLCHPYWRELMRGDFINSIFDSAAEMWQIIGDSQAASPLKSLTEKQKEALFLSAVRLATSEQIACYTDKTTRGVNKLIAAALEYIRSRLARRTRERLDAGLPVTLEKRRFLEWYGKQNKKPGERPGG